MSYKDILAKKRREWSCSELMYTGESRGAKLPFSSPLLNYATYGGIPRNKITEFLGYPGGGKSSTSVDICKNAKKIFDKEYEEQVEKLREKMANGNKEASLELEELQAKGPKTVLYIDLEHSYDGSWAKTLGVRKDDIQVIQPPDVPAEDILQSLQEMIEEDDLGLVVLDSVPSLVTKQELDKKYGEAVVASLPNLLTRFFRKIVSVLERYQCTLIVINQIRDNMDNPYVVQSPGGQALKFYASLRILFKVGPPVDFLGNELPSNAENPAGYLINAKLMKQKSAPFDRKNASYYLMALSGIRTDMDIAKMAVTKYNIIRKSGAWFTMCDPETGEILSTEDGLPVKVNGMVKVFDYLQSHQEYYEKLRDFIMADIEKGGQNDE